VQIKEVHVSTLHLRFCTIAILRLIWRRTHKK
jgi:hypothetical protein